MTLYKTSQDAGVHAWYDVFCKSGECSQWVDGGGTRRDAANNARAHGWLFHRSLGWICPECAKKVASGGPMREST